MFDALAIGDIKLDVFIDLGKKASVACQMNRAACLMSLKYGEKIPVESAVTMMAGSAPNIAIGMRRLGCKIAVVSSIGDDTTAVLAKAVFKKEGLPETFLCVEPKTASSFSAVLNFQGESTILAAHTSHTYRLPASLPTRWVWVTELGPRYRPLFRTIAVRAKHGTFRLAVNPGALQLETLDPSLYALLKESDLLFVNRSEAGRLALQETDDIISLLRKLQKLGPKTVVITDGPKGAYAAEDGNRLFIPAFPSHRKESTGAGDAAASAFLAARIQGKDLETALCWAMTNSASVIEHIGPQAGLLSRKALLRRLHAAGNIRIRAL